MTRYIAEVGPCNDSLAYAHEAVDAAADAGVWGFKVQMYQADRLTTRWAQRYDRLPGKAATQHELFHNALPYADWAEVQAHCQEVGLVFFASVFDEEAIDWCEDHDVPLYKVASGDITHQPLLDSLAQTDKPVLFSTGASYAKEILQAADWLQGLGIPMACTLSYPTRPEDAQTARVTTLLEHFDEVGYSDHTAGVVAAASAAALGASYIECHFTIRPGTGGDHDFAKTEADMRVLDSGWAATHDFRRLVEGNGILAPQPSEMDGRLGARRSIVARHRIEEGQVVRWDDIDFLRPGDGMAPYQWTEVVGKPAIVTMESGQQF
jgi:sialic acid synthase SpsE